MIRALRLMWALWLFDRYHWLARHTRWYWPVHRMVETVKDMYRLLDGIAK